MAAARLAGEGPQETLICRRRGAWPFCSDHLLWWHDWIRAAKAASKNLDIEIETVSIGQGCHIVDPFGDWARARDSDDEGCLLVRPDHHVAFHSLSPSKVAAYDLLAAMHKILGG
jgi:hypothetical protein